MWKGLTSILKKAAKYCVVALTGYEIGDKISEDKNQIIKGTTIIIEESAKIRVQLYFCGNLL